MKIQFTRHALKRFAERQISLQQVLNTLKNSDVKTEEEQNLIAVYKRFKELALKVVFKEEEGELKIITAHWIEKERLKKLKPIIEGER